MTAILTNDEFEVPSGPAGFRRALLINPPVYDSQYWARWSQPAGLLRIATLLRRRGYHLDLLDAMETDSAGYVRKARRRINGEVQVSTRGNSTKWLWHFGVPWDDFERRLQSLKEPPHEVWITSIMTYWWESTRDAVALVRRMFPKADIYVGGIYPTLAAEHARDHLGPAGANVIFKGEIKDASELPTDLSLYATPPSYAILTTTRGCPWECHYCAARALNMGSNKMRPRTTEDVMEEIAIKMRDFNIRRFGFYEDNSLVLQGHLLDILRSIIDQKLNLDLYAPEGFETKFITAELAVAMKQAGFEKIHLPFEALKSETNLGWNRRHASTASFERALDAAIAAGFKPRTQQINAFVLFGLPDERLEDLMDSLLYVHDKVGSIIPMLFTPVPGTQIYKKHADYLHNEMGWDLEDLNGKFLPFLEYNRRSYPELQASDYLEFEGLMSVLNNGKVLSKAVNLCDDNISSKAFRASAVKKLPERVQ